MDISFEVLTPSLRILCVLYSALQKTERLFHCLTCPVWFQVITLKTVRHEADSWGLWILLVYWHKIWDEAQLPRCPKFPFRNGHVFWSTRPFPHVLLLIFYVISILHTINFVNVKTRFWLLHVAISAWAHWQFIKTRMFTRSHKNSILGVWWATKERCADFHASVCSLRFVVDCKRLKIVPLRS